MDGNRLQAEGRATSLDVLQLGELCPPPLNQRGEAEGGPAPGWMARSSAPSLPELYDASCLSKSPALLVAVATLAQSPLG